jgi:hypothetical protein
MTGGDTKLTICDKLLTTNSNWVEASKIEALMLSLDRVGSCETLFVLFLKIIEEINSLVKCKYCTIFLFNEKMGAQLVQTTKRDMFNEHV